METKQNQVAEFNNAWKGRGTLGNLVAELKRQKASRNDFVADTRHLAVRSLDAKSLALAPTTAQAREWLPDGALEFGKGAFPQLLEKCFPSIPKRFGDSCLESKRGNELADFINRLHVADPQKRLVRVLDGKVRAWLSNSYRILDNYDMAFTCMDAAQRCNGQVIEAGLSDTNMRIKFTSSEVWDAIDIKQRSGPQGGWYAGAIGNQEMLGKTILGAKVTSTLPGGPGTVHPVISVSNSETGHGGFNVRIGILMGICYNVATLEEVISQIHLGEKLEEGVFSQETIAADSKSIMLKARDAVLAAFNQDKFRALIAKARKAQAMTLEQPTAAVDQIIEACNIAEEHKEALLEYFLKDYDQTAFGLAQAVSRRAQDLPDSDEAFEFEKLAGKIILQPKMALVTA